MISVASMAHFAPKTLVLRSRADVWVVRASSLLWFGWAVYLTSMPRSHARSAQDMLWSLALAGVGLAVWLRVRFALRFSAWMFVFWFPLFVIAGMLNPSRAMDLRDAPWFGDDLYVYVAEWLAYASALIALGWRLDRARASAQAGD
jgi:hypothetical protein